jgi:hypothetical protein
MRDDGTASAKLMFARGGWRRLARLLYGVRDGIKLSAGASPSTPEDSVPKGRR